MHKSCSHFACKVASMQRRMCGFSGILGPRPEPAFCLFSLRWRRWCTPSMVLPVALRSSLPLSPSALSTCLIVQTSRLHWTLFAYSRSRRRRCRLRRVAFQARRRTCVEVPQSLVTNYTPPRSTSWPYQLCVMVKSHFNSTKLLLSSRSFHMLDNHPNTLHLHSTRHPLRSIPCSTHKRMRLHWICVMVRNVLMFAQKLYLFARNREIKQKKLRRRPGYPVNRARGST